MTSNLEENTYLDLLSKILTVGSIRDDRTGTGTKSIFGTQLRFSLENNQIPMLTTKKMFSKGIIEELLFFLRGETDTKLLEAKGVNIWKGNTSREFLDKRGLSHLPEGDMGKGYGFQWRKFGEDKSDPAIAPTRWSLFNFEGVDQLKLLIEGLKSDPYGRRHIITAWNPQQLSEMALPPCHILVQFYVDNGKLSSQFYMRSVDTFLGLPFNILSYAILTRIIAATVGMEAKEVIFVGGDAHIYQNHTDQVNEQISREPFSFPTMLISKKLETVNDIEALQLSDFKITDYESHPSIKASMAI